MAKQVLFDDEARQALRRGVEQIARAVGVTLGPRGRNVVLQRGLSAPAITNDGAAIAREIELADPFENLGVRLMKEVAQRTAEVAGDGTTTATLLARSLVVHGLQAMAVGARPMGLKRGIETAVAAAVADLARQSWPTRTRRAVAQVATVAAHHDAAIGQLLAEATERVGPEGVISVEEAHGLETSLHVVEGVQFERGYLSTYFVTDPESMSVTLEDAWVLLTDRRVAAVGELLPALDQAARAGRPLLVVADDIEPEALSLLVVNKLRGAVTAVAVKAPEFGEERSALLEDLAVLTGGRVLSREQGRALESAGPEDFGRARRVEVERDRTVLLEGGGRSGEIRGRIASLRRQLRGTTLERDREALRRRLARLTGGVAVIRVGGGSELELRERKARVEDALAATRSAVAEGVVPGGGVALLRATAAVGALPLDGDVAAGRDLVVQALAEPCRQIATNAGAEGERVVATVLGGAGAFGFNAERGVFEDLARAGIVDPTRVVRVALQNAASIGALVLTTDVMVTDVSPGEPPEGDPAA
jgi:chaperonin GroEL